MGGSGVSGTFGNPYRDWLPLLHAGAHGNADLSAHFFRRAHGLLGDHGTIGLVATNTIAQGDTRQTGLRHLIENGASIYQATNNMPWPGDAAVTVAICHLAIGNPAAATRASLNGRATAIINARLLAFPERPDPSTLGLNAELSFLGSKVYGQGFVLSPEERAELVKPDRWNTQRIFPYLGGEEVNTSPTQSHDRYVISFGQMELEEAERWPDLVAIVREKVKPERDRLRNNPDGLRSKQFWWQYQRPRTELYAAIAPLQRCLVTSCHSKHLVFAFQQTTCIFSHALHVFPFEAPTQFALLQSRIHEAWARLLSSSLEDRLRYAASDCFETFPFPTPDPRTLIPALETIGEKLYEARAKYMVDTDQGLTKTYNALKDPDCHDPRILTLRKLHEELDRAVLDAYGWNELQVPPYCPLTPADQGQLQAFKDEVIDRLFVLNAERAAQEAAEAAAAPAPARKRKAKATASIAARTPPAAPSPRPLAKAGPRPRTAAAPKSEPRAIKRTQPSEPPPSQAPARPRKKGGSRR